MNQLMNGILSTLMREIASLMFFHILSTANNNMNVIKILLNGEYL